MSEIEFNEKLRILLVRTGSTDLDDQDRIVGALDMPLSSDGEREARAIAQELKEAGIVAIFSAAGLASQQTARQLSRAGEIKVRVEENFKAEIYNEEFYGADPTQESKDKAIQADLKATIEYLKLLS